MDILIFVLQQSKFEEKKKYMISENILFLSLPGTSIVCNLFIFISRVPTYT